MEPPGGVEALQGTLRLLAGLLALCLALLFLLNGVLLLRRRPAWPRGAAGKVLLSQAPPARSPPPPLQALPSGAVAGRSRRGAVAKPLRGQAAALWASPLPSCCPAAAAAAAPRRWREPLGGPRPAAFCSQGSISPSGDVDKLQPVLAPPNSPVTTAGSREVVMAAGRDAFKRGLDKFMDKLQACVEGVTGGGSTNGHTSTQSKLRSCSRSVWRSHLRSTPFEYGSSIRRHDERTGLNSANFTASQGPGLDSNFGASAGISVRILSSDSEDSPNAAQPPPQQVGQFEWDYYDPGYKQRTQLPQGQLPQICSKQYWL